MQPIAVAVGLTVTILALTALLAGPQFAYLAPHTRVLTTQYWPALTAYGVPASSRSRWRSTPQRARPGSRTSGEKSIWWNGRSGAARAAIRSWPDRCSSRTGESLTNDAQGHRARLETRS